MNHYRSSDNIRPMRYTFSVGTMDPADTTVDGRAG